MESELKQKNFCNSLKNYKILFNKSQIPSIKIEKENALLVLQKDILEKTGVNYNEAQLRKKIQNMKMDVKKKTDLKATGNKPIILKSWERDVLELMDHSSNPTFQKVPCSTSVGFNETKEETDVMENLNGSTMYAKEVSEEPKPKKMKTSSHLPQETEETVKLSTPDLQRLVLLEQLKLIRLLVQNEESKNVEALVKICNDI